MITNDACFHGTGGFQTHQRAKKVVSNTPRASRYFYGATVTDASVKGTPKVRSCLFLLPLFELSIRQTSL